MPAAVRLRIRELFAVFSGVTQDADAERVGDQSDCNIRIQDCLGKLKTGSAGVEHDGIAGADK